MRELEVRTRIKQASKTWEQFLEFMANQTVSAYPDGETRYVMLDDALEALYAQRREIEKLINDLLNAGA